MTLRETIADWISGGALAKRDAKIHDLQQMCGSWRVNAYDESGRTRMARRKYFKLRSAILAIIDRGNTTSPNSTVKAMQKIALEALDK